MNSKRNINRRNLSKVDYDKIEHENELKKKYRRKQYMEYFRKKMESSNDERVFEQN